MENVNTLVLNVTSDEDYFGNVSYENVVGTTAQGTSIVYYVHDLCNAPEDATVDRDLFSAEEYIETLRLGMKLAQEGYTDIVACYSSELEQHD